MIFFAWPLSETTPLFTLPPRLDMCVFCLDLIFRGQLPDIDDGNVTMDAEADEVGVVCE